MPLPHSIDAPYNFVPLADWVYCPDWASQVSHDLPFKDGLCGHLELTITAHSPVLVGREHRPDEAPCAGHPGQVHPYQLPDGRYALPGTALKGMLRNVIEIATFSRMALVDDQRLGVRDLTGGLPAYQKAMTQTIDGAFKPLARPGWLSFHPDHLGPGRGCWLIQACEYARIERSVLEAFLAKPWVKISKKDRPTTKEKYDAWLKHKSLSVTFDVGLEQSHKHSKDKEGKDKYLIYRKATNLGTGSQRGMLVFTGQPSPQKHMEFIFFGAIGTPIRVREEIFRGFLDIHDQRTANGPESPWAYWRNQARVPVFWLDDGHGGVASLGLAMMYKLPYTHSLHDAIGHSSPRHLEDHRIDQLDLTTLLFGRVGQKPEDCLRGRVTIHHAVPEGQTQPQALPATILNGPKPTYYPNYICQPNAQNNRIPQKKRYSTLMEPDCKLRGWKRYPARPVEQVEPQSLTAEQTDNQAVQVILNPLPAGTIFRTRLTFHNLRPVELGALCWALTWGGQPSLRHSLGMGKPFGYGQIGIMIDAADLRPNRLDTTAPTWCDCVTVFIETIEKAHRTGRPQGGPWRDSREIRTLLAMADPNRQPFGDSRLRHMHLSTEQENDFKDAKNARLVLADYPLAPAPKWMTEDADAPPAPTTWPNVTLRLVKPGSGELSVTHAGMSAFAVNPEAQNMRAALPQVVQERLKKKHELKDCTVTVEKIGNAWKLIGIAVDG